ncbi:hypothetical protein DFA_04479 [Cavenderia fasciculata]|uniref:NADH dehydrogenase [ubiquinone] 1 beta subcomplex subunit 7 n=1 Tax=Cavenderia fasciculata TaxID=261658 RepID=F4PPP8_CACFS|nr:uncharacterized protein DFA_04479 [Cavenderia fasciculata]EGG22361.1 hypothetical protein DFA_04479 [Cavenderia fasciculata]|eukprot:XP_004360212.1 hypothetical protein DFA_04479 [Cavenderia fasciculata]
MGHHETPPLTIRPDGTRVMIATSEELEANAIPLNFRDYCAHLLIPLNNCRVKESYAPWKCSDERHAYEKCQYDEYLLRMKQKREQDLFSKQSQKDKQPQQPYSTENY